MGIFICHECGHMGDSDDGCDATPDGMNLICITCLNERDDDPIEDTLEKMRNAARRDTCILRGDPIYDREWDEIRADLAEEGIDQ